LGRLVAVKALKPKRAKGDLTQDWLKQEAEAVARLDHPSIVTIFDVGACPAGPYLVMELLQGETLADRLRRGSIPVGEALRVAEWIAEGLAHAHSRGVLHRDLKPANVFLCSDGRVKLLDFGLAHLLGTGGTGSGGTPGYMAPEQARGGAIDQRADVYSAAAVLVEMLTGVRPGSKGAAVVAGGMARPLAKVLEAALRPEPSGRPADGQDWREALRGARQALERPRRLRRTAVFAILFVLVGLVAEGLATWRVWERQITSGRPTVAVADFANETGEPELDGLSGLLITALEQSARLRVLTRGRMVDVLQQLGKHDVKRVDEALAREVGRETRATALLLASIRKLGGVYVVEMRALDPLHDEYLFTVSDRATDQGTVFDLVDRLGEATRKRLGDGGEVDAGPLRKVATITTASLKAWDFFERSKQAYGRNDVAASRSLAEAALKEDPEFALAHLQLANLGMDLDDGSRAQREAAVALIVDAERYADRLPEKERLELRFARAYVDGRPEEARRLALEFAEAYPLDKGALWTAGDVHFHLGEFEEAIPHLERLLRLDPGFQVAIPHLVEAVTASGHAEEHVDLFRRLARSDGTPNNTRNAGIGLLAAGLEQEAVEAFRKADLADGYPWPPGWYVLFLLHEGRAAEAEEMLRGSLGELMPEAISKAPWKAIELRRNLATALAAQGRVAESKRQFDEVLQASQQGGEPTRGPAARSGLLLASYRGDPVGVRAAAEELSSEDQASEPQVAIVPVVALASAGDLAGAGRLAARARDRGRAHWLEERLGGRKGVFFVGFGPRLLEAMAHLDDGAGALARSELESIASHQSLPFRCEGLVILGEWTRQQGRCAESVRFLEQARGLAWSFTPGWVGSCQAPRLLTSLSDCYERLGDVARAQERNREFLRLWARADPDLALLAEARAREARLALSVASAGR
jgi:tetratricopeptide (TPR) repeat protein/TolB-like protein